MIDLTLHVKYPQQELHKNHLAWRIYSYKLHYLTKFLMEGPKANHTKIATHLLKGYNNNHLKKYKPLIVYDFYGLSLGI